MKPETPEIRPDVPGGAPLSIPANTLAAVVSQVGGRALGLLVVVLLVRHFPVDAYGRFAFAFTLALFVAPWLDLGTDAHATRLLAMAPERTREVLGASLALKLALWAAVAPLALLVGAALGYPRPTLELLLAALVAGGVTALAASFATIFRARRRLDIEAGLSLAGRAATVALTLAALAAAGGILAMGWAQVGGGLAALAAAGWLGLRHGAWPRLAGAWRAWPELIRGGMPFAATAVLVMIYFRIDTLMLAHLSGERSVGFYNANVNLVFAAMLLSQALVMAVFPVLAGVRDPAEETARRVMRRGLGLSLAAALPIAIAAAFFGRPILTLLYGAPYAEGARSLALLMGTLPALFVTNLVGHALGALGRQRLVLGVAAVNAAVNVALNLWLIPRFDYDGASAATLVTELVGVGAFAALLRPLRAAWVDAGAISRVLAANAGLLLLWVALRGQPWLVALLGGVACYGTALFLMRLIRREDFAAWAAPSREAGR
jgi:O-antigen/teichoic acid export membrane protein